MTKQLRDPGDDVQRRFRYQINYAALKALQLLADGTSVRAVYCEYHEDVLIENDSGRFIAIQIKTRELDQKQFRLSEPSVVGSLKRFCVRAARYPGMFEKFILATNYVFHKGDGDDDLSKLLHCCRHDPGLAGLGPRHKLRKRIAEFVKSTGVGQDKVIEALGKVQLEERKTGIDQIELELVRAIGELDQLGHQSQFELMRMADQIRGHVWNASSLALEGYILDTHAVAEDLRTHLELLRTEKKRIDRELMVRLTTPSASGLPELLTIREFVKREAIPPGLGRMELKMAAGGVGYSEVEQMKDDVASLEVAFLGWKEKFGLAEANKRLAHFQYLARKDAREAETNTASGSGPYGSAMLVDLRKRARATAAHEGDRLFGCRSEHLVGTAGLLSEECKVWWSGDHDLGPLESSES